MSSISDAQQICFQLDLSPDQYNHEKLQSSCLPLITSQHSCTFTQRHDSIPSFSFPPNCDTSDDKIFERTSATFPIRATSTSATTYTLLRLRQ